MLKRDISKKQSNKILFVGRDFERKGGYLVLKAFELLKKEMPSAMLYIAGGFSIQQEGVICLGDVPTNQLYKYFNECDIFCMPSYFEAYGIVFVEALTFGLPCIGRNKFEMPKFIEHGKTGFLIDNDDEIKLSLYMKELLTNSFYRQQICANFEKYKEEYSWNSVAKRMINYLDGEINENKSGNTFVL